MTASDDLLTLLGSAYDAVASRRLPAPALDHALCVVTDEIGPRQERLPLVLALVRLADLTASGHRVVGGTAPRAAAATGAGPPDPSLLVDQVNLSATALDRTAAPLDLVGRRS
ncbi:hypothetical protein NPS01_16260 [Nocardioides psychrotolerans]|uniref:Uncharacterized protein n=1 Tax=Nocardioides psychrotolerans TaxID=1005945 RepID=A0A1I3RLP9_9ACTN|nr:hypothetical protein [Nocardioides psychrotolerans]GEP37963.1 hypothetical protein NPS01_16260 [Nocardioides psychrotolerans]SFJ46950.1 hypothetical protein SAMN05216561_1342 [Nocardioides psychrotolerans]